MNLHYILDENVSIHTNLSICLVGYVSRYIEVNLNFVKTFVQLCNCNSMEKRLNAIFMLKSKCTFKFTLLYV